MVGEPRGGGGPRGREVRQVRGDGAAIHGRGAHAGPAGARRRGAHRLRLHRQVSAAFGPQLTLPATPTLELYTNTP